MKDIKIGTVIDTTKNVYLKNYLNGKIILKEGDIIFSNSIIETNDGSTMIELFNGSIQPLGKNFDGYVIDSVIERFNDDKQLIETLERIKNYDKDDFERIHDFNNFLNENIPVNEDIRIKEERNEAVDISSLIEYTDYNDLSKYFDNHHRVVIKSTSNLFFHLDISDHDLVNLNELDYVTPADFA